MEKIIWPGFYWRRSTHKTAQFRYMSQLDNMRHFWTGWALDGEPWSSTDYGRKSCRLEWTLFGGVDV